MTHFAKMGQLITFGWKFNRPTTSSPVYKFKLNYFYNLILAIALLSTEVKSLSEQE